MSGSLVTQYKIGHWLGATPRTIEVANILGSVVASAATTAVIMLMASVYGFTPDAAHPDALPAPQPNAMAAVLRGVMGSEGAPWFLYGVGAVFAVAVELCGVSGLAFALGMYLPMELNSPLVVGAAVAWLLRRSSKDGGRGQRPATSRGRSSPPASSPAGRWWASSPRCSSSSRTGTGTSFVPDLTAPAWHRAGCWRAGPTGPGCWPSPSCHLECTSRAAAPPRRRRAS